MDLATFYVEKESEKMTQWGLNPEPFTPIPGQQGAQFLARVIRHWMQHVMLFGKDVTWDAVRQQPLPTHLWRFVLEPEDKAHLCPLRKIFGPIQHATCPPFLYLRDDEIYGFWFRDLESYALGGDSNLAIDREARRLCYSNERTEERMIELLGGHEIGACLRRQLLETLTENPIDSIKVIDPQFAIVQGIKQRSFNGNAPTSNRWINVHFHGKTMKAEWEMSKDDPRDILIPKHAIRRGGATSIEVDLLRNNEVVETFTFVFFHKL